MIEPFESLFTFLFKYPPEVFEKGRLVLAGMASPPVLIAALVILAIPVVGSYRRTGGRARGRDRTVLATIRLAAIATVCFCLAGPALELTSAVPQRNFVGILLDDSRSMRIADENGSSRADVLRRLFGQDSSLTRALADRFQLRFFRFGANAGRVEDPATLAFADSWTRLGPALRRAGEELGQVPLAGLVVVTDGAENPRTSLLDSLSQILPSGVPIYAVGLGSERFEKDIEIADVQSPAATLQGSTVAVDLTIRASGFSGRTVRVHAEESGRIMAEQQVRLGSDGTASGVRLLVPAPDPGTRTIRFVAAVQPGESVVENNQREAVMTVRRGPEKILYFEGEPRFELKFIRRAVAGDENLQLAILLRTALEKYLRLGVEDSLELVSGFPRTREELFAYRGIILGSIEANALTVEQLRMLADFVSVRGGGLLVLGGRRALAEGGYAETPLARALPVILGAPDTGFFVPVTVHLTSAGSQEPSLQLTGDSRSTTARWDSLPQLTAVNHIGNLKPGATTLIEGTTENFRQPVLAYHRYGRGKAIAFAVQDSWLWQMHADMSLEDQTHETLWRQLLRWLVSDVPEPMALTLSADRIPPGEPVAFSVDLRNARYDAVNDATVRARVIAPSGKVSDIVMPWSGTQDGLYRLDFSPEETGRHELTVEATGADDDRAESSTASFSAGESEDELKGATLQAASLRRVAEATGGRFYTAATVSALPDDIAIGGAGVTVREQRDLWDMPAIFLMLMGMLATEWGYRRWRGLA